MSTTPAPVEALAAIDRALARAPARPWAVFGGQAVLVHGTPRLTADLDILIDPGSWSPRDVAERLADERIAWRFEPAPEDLASARLLLLVHAPTKMPIDAVLVAPGVQREFVERAERVDVGGAVVPVVGPTDLLIQKILAGRRKDLEDARGVLARRAADLDLDRVRAVLRPVDAATDRGGLFIRRLDRLLAPRRTRS